MATPKIVKIKSSKSLKSMYCRREKSICILINCPSQQKSKLVLLGINFLYKVNFRKKIGARGGS